MPKEPATSTGRIIEQNQQEERGMAEARVSFHIGVRASARGRARTSLELGLAV